MEPLGYFTRTLWGVKGWGVGERVLRGASITTLCEYLERVIVKLEFMQY